MRTLGLWCTQELNEWRPFWKPKKASTELLLARSRSEDAPGSFSEMSPAVTSSRACLWLSLTILALAPPAGSTLPLEATIC